MIVEITKSGNYQVVQNEGQWGVWDNDANHFVYSQHHWVDVAAAAIVPEKKEAAAPCK